MRKIRNKIRRFFKRLSLKRGEKYVALRIERFLKWENYLDSYPSKNLGELYVNNGYIRKYFVKYLSGYKGIYPKEHVSGEWNDEMLQFIERKNLVYKSYVYSYENAIREIKNRIYHIFPEERNRYGYIDFDYVRLVKLENAVGETYLAYVVPDEKNEIIGGFGLKYLDFHSITEDFVKVSDFVFFNDTWLIKPMTEEDFKYLRSCLHYMIDKDAEIDTINTAWEKQNTYYKLKTS